MCVKIAYNYYVAIQSIAMPNKEHIGLVGKISIGGYSDQRFKLLMHQNVVSLWKALNQNCLGGLS